MLHWRSLPNLRKSIMSPRIVLTSKHTLLCSHTLNNNWFNHIESAIFSLNHSRAVYIRVALTGDTLTQQTKVRQMEVHSGNLAGRVMGLWHPGPAHMRDTLPCTPCTGFQNTILPPKSQGNITDCNQNTNTWQLEIVLILFALKPLNSYYCML